MTHENTNPIEQKGERHLTIQPKSGYSGNNIHPEIRVAGKYLEALGFAIGRKVTMITEPNKLTITLDPAPPELDPAEHKRRVKEYRQTMKDLHCRLFETYEPGNY